MPSAPSQGYTRDSVGGVAHLGTRDSVGGEAHLGTRDSVGGVALYVVKQHFCKKISSVHMVYLIIEIINCN